MLTVLDRKNPGEGSVAPMFALKNPGEGVLLWSLYYGRYQKPLVGLTVFALKNPGEG